MLISKNRKALFDHELLEKFTAGMILRGYEVKAIKENKANFEGSYVQLIEGEPFVVNMYIGRYSKQSTEFNELDARRNKKLLLNKNEIDKIAREVSQKGKTAVPLALILDKGKIRLEFAIVRGQKEFEKKQVAKERQIQKDLAKETKELKSW
jgi:SsrA-binding protein